MSDVISGGNSPVVSSGDSFASSTAVAEASPASDSPNPTQDATAAAQPASDSGQPQQTDERSPFIPRDRFDQVNTERNELKAWRESRAWAEQVSGETFNEMARWYQSWSADPVAFLQHVSSELQQHPTYGQQLRSLAAKTLAAHRGQAQQPNFDGIVVDLGNGQQIALTDFANHIREQVRSEFAPMAKTVEQVQAERQQAAQKAEADSFSTGFYGELKALPNFAKVEGAIKRDLAQLSQAGQLADDPAAIRAATYQLYLKHGLPTLTQSAQTQLLDSLQQKAAAASSVNPGTAANAAPRRYRSFDELGPDAWR